MGLLPRRSPQPFLVAAFVLLSAGIASAFWGSAALPLAGSARFPAPVPLLPSFFFVPAATLVACLAALVLEVSFVGYVSESSWETDFSGDEFVTGGATWCEKSFESYVSESSWETAFNGDKGGYLV